MGGGGRSYAIFIQHAQIIEQTIGACSWQVFSQMHQTLARIHF
jgi:hypothetical protein